MSPLRAATPNRTRRALAAVAALTLVGLAGASCSSGSDESASSVDMGSGSDAAMAPEPGMERGIAEAPEVQDGSGAKTGVGSSSGGDTAESTGNTYDPDSPTDARALIKTGNVALRSPDVAQARFDVQKIVDRHRGQIAGRTTEADKDGVEERARLVLRVPAGEFDGTLEDLEGVGDLLSSDAAEEDVTTQVIDTEVRIKLQRRSIERISVLLDRAGSIRAIVEIERELSRREADLGSLEKRQAYFADQTAMATITVSIERPGTTVTPIHRGHVEVRGFLAGLASGWAAFTAATVSLLTVTGAVLPFVLLLLVLAVPARLLLRRTTTGRSTPAASGPADLSPDPGA